MAIRVIEGFEFDDSPTFAKAEKKRYGRLTKVEASVVGDDLTGIAEDGINISATGRYDANALHVNCADEYIPQAGPVTDYASFGTYLSIPIPETTLDTYGVIGFSAAFGILPNSLVAGGMQDASDNDGMILFSIGNLATDYGNIFVGIRASDDRMYLKVLDTAVPIHVSTGLTGTNSSKYRGYHFNNGTCTISTFTPVANVWYTIEVKYKFSATVGHVLLYVNGSLVAQTATNINFVNSFRNGAFLSSMFSLVTANPGTPESLSNFSNAFDDFYMLDSTGNRNTDYIGSFRVRKTHSTADHINQGYSDGVHYTAAQSDDDDTSYISVESGQIESFGLSDLTNISSRIRAVQYNYSTYFETNNNGIRIVPLAQGGAGQAMHSGFVNQIPVSGGGYFYHSVPIESSLINGGDWTIGHINDGYHGFTIFS